MKMKESFFLAVMIIIMGITVLSTGKWAWGVYILTGNLKLIIGGGLIFIGCHIFYLVFKNQK